ncbi:MAG: hypothetical protein U1E30_05030 [Rhodoblastus sp.]
MAGNRAPRAAGSAAARLHGAPADGRALALVSGFHRAGLAELFACEALS